MDENPQSPEEASVPFEPEPLTPRHPVADAMNLEDPAASTAESAFEPAAFDPESQVTAQTLVRDAVLDLSAAVALAIVPATVLAGLAMLVYRRHQIDAMLGTSWGIVALLLSTQLPMLIVALRRRRRNLEKQRTLPDLFAGDPGVGFRRGFIVGLGMITLSMFYMLAVQRVMGEGAVENQLGFLENLLQDRVGVTVLVVIISGVAPCIEELFFRGVIFGSGHAAGLSKVTAATSAALFAIVHLSPLLAPFYATFGLVMCWLYASTRTLVAPIVAHMTLNGMACLAVLIAGRGDMV